MKRLCALIAAVLSVITFVQGDIALASETGFAKKTEAEWVTIPGAQDSKTTCIGATENDTRFLMYTLVNRLANASGYESRLYIFDAQTGKETDLFLSDSMDADAIVNKLLKSWDMENEKGADFAKSYGSSADFAIHWMWRGWCLPIQTYGDYFLVHDLYLGDVLIDAGTGETVLLGASITRLAVDGRVAVCQYLDQFSIYDPVDRTYSPFVFEGSDNYSPMCAQPLSSGGVVCSLRNKKSHRKDKEIVHDCTFTYFSADGSMTHTIDAGEFRIGFEPQRLFYSEQTGVGIAYNMNAIQKSPLLIFRQETEYARVLWLDSPDALRAREVDRSEVIDDTGSLLADQECELWPIGLSRDGRCMMFYDIKNSNLLLMDLDTLNIHTLLTDTEMKALFEMRSIDDYNILRFLHFLGWNGSDILTGWNVLPGYALRICFD